MIIICTIIVVVVVVINIKVIIMIMTVTKVICPQPKDGWPAANVPGDARTSLPFWGSEE